MSLIHGFELVQTRDIPEINSIAKFYRHERTGLQLLSVENDDENKCFGVSFKTPVADSTGVPHILEHSVLNGSRKYPIKEPFVELLKTSLASFINAMTFYDFTIYPVASTNLHDFYNLIDVYLDAVFYPNITEQTFQQEGWHHEINSKDDPLVFKGVVFNEMKAAYSSPDRVLDMRTQEALLPDTPYALSSGGDPTHIPDLTYEQFVNFHRDYYHPSQAHVFFYGDDEPNARLKLIDEFIAGFQRRQVDTTVPLQPRWSEPREVTLPYDAGDADADTNKTLMTVSWLLTEVSNEEEMLALGILEHILIGTSASPLRKVLIESGLGEDLTGGGVDPYMREAVFSVGLKGINKASAQKVEDTILQTMSALADDGIDKATIEASLNTIEFQMREKNTGRFPKGLAALISIMPSWLHGGDPVERLAFEEELEKVKQKYEDDPSFFEHLIGKYFLDNPHRSTVVLEPDPEVKVKREAAEAKRLEEARATMDDAALDEIIKTVQELQLRQETPDSPEDLAKIPTLTIDDLEREIKTTPQQDLVAHDAPILYHDLPTSGIAYLDLGFNMRSLPAKYLPYIPLFGRALTQIGTKTQNFVQLQQRIGANTGGIGASTMTSKVVTSNAINADDTAAYIFLRGKAMMHQTGELVDILRDILLTINLDNQERFKQMVLESKARAESTLGVAGHITVMNRLKAHFTTADWASEQMGGISNLFFLRELAERVEKDWPSVLADLQEIHSLLINRQSMLANITLESENWTQFQPQLENLMGALPQTDFAAQDWSHQPLAAREGFTVPAQVNFVGKAADMYTAGYEKDGSYIAVLKYANLDYMWNKIRVMGGAYGGAMIFDHTSGIISYLSWRDPNLVGTLKNYDGAADYLQKLSLTEGELEKAIIGAIGDVDQYQLPDAKGYGQMQRTLIGITDEMRQQTRDELLGTTMADFKQFGERLADALQNSKVAVVGGPSALEKANAELDEKIDVTNVL